MELLLLLTYSFIAWLIFGKFKLLPWNIVTQVITITIPIIGIAILILLLNIYAPSTSDVRVMNYVVPINPTVRGRVIEVPVQPNVPVRKGDVLFRLDPLPFEIQVQAAEAQVRQFKAQLITATANQRNLSEQLLESVSREGVANAELLLARKRVAQFEELARLGAGNLFDLEQAQAQVQSLENELRAARAGVAQVRERLAATTPEGVLDQVAQVLAQIAAAEATLADAHWQLEQTVAHAPADGTVVALALRPGVMTVPLPLSPAMTFIEDEQFIVGFFRQNEVRKVEPGNEVEIFVRTHPGRVIKAEVDSVIWATAQGQLPISGQLPDTGFGAMPEQRLAVKFRVTGKDAELFLAPGARGGGAIYTDSGHMIHIIRKVFVRVSTKLDWLILKLH
jgi:multidrug resistance efflux pump